MSDSETITEAFFDAIRWDSRGLIPVVVQDGTTRDVVMVAYMNREALTLTARTGKATYWSRSRNTLWLKGETSGHFQAVRSIHVDCDGDTLLLIVDQKTAACHTGHWSCFYRMWDGEWKEVGEKVFDEHEVYGGTT